MKKCILMVGLVLGAMQAASAADFSFSRPVRLTLERNSAGSVAIGDANGDGRKDIALVRDVWETMTPYNELSLYLQRADGTLAAPINLQLPNLDDWTVPVAFADLDKDGAQDLVVGGPNTAIRTVRLAGGALTATNHAIFMGCEYIATGDIDGDGNVDVACHDAQTTATLFYGNGAGGFRNTVEMQTGAGYWVDLWNAQFKTVQLADVTGDGRLDLLVTSSDASSYYVYANNGLGGLYSAGTAYAHVWSPSGTWPAAMQALDLDGDGINEVVTATPDNRPNGALNVYRRGANGYLVLSERRALYDSTTALLAADLDGNGDQELVAAHWQFHAVTVFGGAGAGVGSAALYDLPGFGNTVESMLQYRYPRYVGSSQSFALGDVDGDGCGDLAAATHSGLQVLYGCEPFIRKIPVSDFDGDGVSDLLWRYDALSLDELWQFADLNAWYACRMDNCPTLIPPPWKAQAFGDFDGDGNSDVFWRNQQTGQNLVHLAAFFPRTVTTVTNLAWQVVGTGDFDGDDRSDLLWRNTTTGANSIWRAGDSTAPIAISTVNNFAWKIAAIGDFDGDGRSDVLWRNGTSGANQIWRSGNSATLMSMTMVNNLAWKIVGTGDFDGDGRDDVVWRSSANGANTIWRSANSTTQIAVTTVNNMDWNIAGIGDYNGDGRSDLVWRNGRTGANQIWRSGNSATPQAVATLETVFYLLPAKQ